jgi:phenylalanyl-tRNA synthetase beta subunit
MASDHSDKHEKVTKYFVNGEAETTTEHKLKVRDVITGAGFTPAENYELTRDEGNKTFDDLDEEIPIHEGERFTATYKGTTPTS